MYFITFIWNKDLPVFIGCYVYPYFLAEPLSYGVDYIGFRTFLGHTLLILPNIPAVVASLLLS